MSEYIELYDKDRNRTGTIVDRDEKPKFPDDEYALIVNAVIFNGEGEMLIQKRASTEKEDPDLWDISAGGHALVDEDSQDAVRRELYEELGIDYDFSDERPYLTEFADHYIRDIYIIELDFDPTALRLQYSEVSNAAWVDLADLKHMYNEGKVIQYNPGFLELLFHFKNGRGIKIKKEKID